MPSRIHWVYMATPGSPRFDANARAYFQESVRRKAMETLPALAYDRLTRRLDRLSMNFRKALPELLEIATEQGYTFTKKLRKFRLPKRLRKTKNPIYSWKNA